MQERKISSRIDDSAAGKPLLAWLTARFTYADEAQWRQFICEGRLKSGDLVLDEDHLLLFDETVDFTPPPMIEPDVDINFKIIADTPDFAVVSKPANLPVHPSGRFFNHTLWFLLRQKWPWFHFCSRLDRETSGLMLIALSKKFLHHWLSAGSAGTKEYSALVHGHLVQKIDAAGFLQPDPRSQIRKKRQFLPDQNFYHDPDSLTDHREKARTIITPVEFSALHGHTRVKCLLLTGRTHQIRATLLALGYPLVGDKLYGRDETLFLRYARHELTPQDRDTLVLDRQALHCSHLAFTDADLQIREFFDKEPF